MFVRTKEEINRAKRRGETFSIILTDLDRFKLVNDTYGHDAGDKILKVFSSILRKHTRKYDIVARFGGEEFIIFLSATNKENAKKKAEQLREYVERSEVYIRDVDKKVKFTASFGVSELLPEDNYDVEKVIKRADKALYLAKNSGRNMVITD
ncbi:GGDEF domain-containing protein [Caloramator sp. Dgby_cultured_2]|uniref:GGDEF domain-containing protein n=1 Tax=Caloramator sp. Dgby_cultured_2 TaxID=3029174 RepID=UPI00237DEE4B|nr:GGDEF domain-containing protein [Caloramator sp. Dgby_cultured_2]WDU84557.1 GGDEF domain-containing protein [Caloramator sp. Dgby_cultured_2]